MSMSNSRIAAIDVGNDSIKAIFGELDYELIFLILLQEIQKIDLLLELKNWIIKIHWMDLHQKFTPLL